MITHSLNQKQRKWKIMEREVLIEIETNEIVSDIKCKDPEKGGAWFIKLGFHWKYGKLIRLTNNANLVKKGLSIRKIQITEEKEEVYAKVK